MTFPEDTKEELAYEAAKEWQTRALKAEAWLDARKHGFCNSDFTVYGTEPAIKQLSECYAELVEFRRISAKEEELRAANAKVDWFEKREALMRQCALAYDSKHPGDAMVALGNLRQWEREHPRPGKGQP